MKNIRFTFAVQKYYFFLICANKFALLARILYYIGKKRMHMRQIFSLLMAMTLCVGTASACMKKASGLAVRGDQPLTVIVMDTTQALLDKAQVKVQKDVYTTSYDGRVVLKAEQVTSTTFLVSCEGYKPAHAIVKDEPVLIVQLLPDPKKQPKDNGTGPMYVTGARRGDVFYSKAATPSADVAMLSVAESEDVPVRESAVAMPGGKNNVSAGLLTAGEVNDFTKWYFWPRVIDDSHKQHVSAWQIAPRHRYSAQVVNNAGYPIASKAVSLLDNAGNTLFQAVTDNTGKAELWYQLLGNNLCGKHADFYIAVDDQKQLAKQWSDGLNTFVLDEPCQNDQIVNDQLVNDVDVVFVFDATGSMGDELRYLQAEMKDVISRATEATGGLQIRTGAVVYRDHQDEYLTRISRLTEDIKTTQSFIDKQQANGGGDYPEAVPEALMAAMNSAGWDTNARARIAFLILDAPCHQDSATIALLHEQVLNAAALGVRIVPVVCSGIGESGELLVRSIALATNGTSFFLTDDSGIGHSHLKPTTDSLKVEHLNDMMVRTIVEFSAMPVCNEVNDQMVEDQIVDDFLPNPFSAEEVAADPSIPHGEGIHYVIDISGKLLTIYEGDIASLKTQLRSMGLPVGIYFIKTFYDGIWHTEKVLNLG